MKNLAVYIVMVCFLIACSDDDKAKSTDAELIGTWKLSQVYMDPGDGSGDFTNVDSEKTITFLSDGTVNSNTDLCFMSSEIGQPSTGTFSETEMIITVLDCDVSPFELFFEIEENHLMVSYFCIEACQEKYVKL